MLITIFKLFIESLKENGLIKTFKKLASFIIDSFFDKKYNTDTSSWVETINLDVNEQQKKHAEMYQNTHALPLKKLLKTLPLPNDKILVDLGCGKARVLLVASQCGFKEARGIEFSKNLCEIANNNIKIFKNKTDSNVNFLIINSDVSDHDFDDDENVFFLFNPFDNYILEKVLHKINESLQRKNRKIWIIYRNALYKDSIEKALPTAKKTEYNYWGQDFVVYELS
ncbi:hypothetical protein BVY03_01155 [bacterium K02(2017)]|nr:hypothetical protein BVY03_01155 [bacterium K02(2017)]